MRKSGASDVQSVSTGSALAGGGSTSTSLSSSANSSCATLDELLNSLNPASLDEHFNDSERLTPDDLRRLAEAANNDLDDLIVLAEIETDCQPSAGGDAAQPAAGGAAAVTSQVSPQTLFGGSASANKTGNATQQNNASAVEDVVVVKP